MKKLKILAVISMLVLGFGTGHAFGGDHILTTPEMKSPSEVLYCTIINVHAWDTMDVKVELINAEAVPSQITASTTCTDVPPEGRCVASALHESSFRFCRFTTNLSIKDVRAAILGEIDADGTTTGLPAY